MSAGQGIFSRDFFCEKGASNQKKMSIFGSFMVHVTLSIYRELFTVESMAFGSIRALSRPNSAISRLTIMLLRLISVPAKQKKNACHTNS